MSPWKPCALLALLLAGAALPGRGPAAPTYAWTRLDTVPYKGKQDDIVFVDPRRGWYVNGAGKIYRTEDGGGTWTEQLSQPGTFFRCVGFLDALHGFAGNIGPDYFPGVTDPKPLYETQDGGLTWKAVETIQGPAPTGLCAIEIQRRPTINAGYLDQRITLWAGGRVGGPAHLLKSTDLGRTWLSQDLGALTAMILDIKFFDGDTGILCGATDPDVEKSHALILRTTDGGRHWKKVYESKRPWELTWKGAFPSRKVGYVTVQNYDPDKANTRRVVAKTLDGGRTWKEVPLANDHAVRAFGVGFLDEKVGWVGALPHAFQTLDGGRTWTPTDMGPAINKIRILPTEAGFVAYAIGVDVRKLEGRRP